MFMLPKVEKKNGVTVEKFFFPIGRGVVTRQLFEYPTKHLDVYVSDLCRFRHCWYPTTAHMTCKNCPYKM